MISIITKLAIAYNQETNTAYYEETKIGYGNTRLLRNFDAENFIIIDKSNKEALISKGGEQAAKVIELDYNSTHHGIMLNNEHYIPLAVSASGSRKANVLFCKKSTYKEVFNFLTCGIGTKGLNTAKYSKYMMLAMSADNKWEDICHYAPCPTFERTATLADCEINYKGVFDYVSRSQFKEHQEIEVTNKISDGLCILIVNDLGLSKEERNKLIESIDAFTIRNKGVKGLCQPVLRSDVNTFIAQHGASKMINTVYGVKNIDDVDLIMFKSSFKWSKILKTKEQFDQYVAKCHEYHDEFSIAVNAHTTKRPMAYQPYGLMSIGNDRIEYYIDRITNRFDEYQTIEGQSKLLSGNLRKIVELCPEAANDSYIASEMDIAWVSKRKEAMGGKNPGMVRNLFAAPDMLTIMCHVFGVKHEMQIAENNVICKAFREGEEIADYRNPVSDPAMSVKRVKHAMRYPGFYLGTTVFYPAYGSDMIRLQMDYDGDHVSVTNNQHVVEDVKETIRSLNIVPLYFEPNDAVEEAQEYSYKELLGLIDGLHVAPIGIYAMANVKRIAYNAQLEKPRKRSRMAERHGKH